MDDALSEDFAGPGKLRIFQVLISVIVYALILGTILSIFYDIHIVENIAIAAANNLSGVFELAGVIAAGLFAIKAIAYADEVGLLGRY